MVSASQYLENTITYLLGNRIKYTDIAKQHHAKNGGFINYDFTGAYATMINDMKMYLNNKIMKVSSEQQLFNYGNYQNVNNAIGCNVTDYPLSSFLKSLLPQIDFYPQPIKQVIIDYCKVYLDNDYKINYENAIDIEIICAYVSKILVKVMYLFKYEPMQHFNDINELNKLIKPFNVEYHIMGSYSAFHSDITYKIIHANKDSRDKIKPLVEFLEQYYKNVENAERIIPKEIIIKQEKQESNTLVQSQPKTHAQNQVTSDKSKLVESKSKITKKDNSKNDISKESSKDSSEDINDSDNNEDNVDSKKTKIKKTATKTSSKKIPAAVRKIVWNTYIGKNNSTGKCLVCSDEDISHTNFECGHVKSRINGGEVTVDNLRPICGNCNKSIGGNDMDVFMTKFNIKQPDNWNGLVKSDDDDPVSSEKKVVKSKVKKEVLLDKKENDIEQLQARIIEVEHENTTLKAEIKLLKLKLAKYE
jgi:hypothetical protein